MAEPRYVARPVSFSQTNAGVKGGTMRCEEFVTHEVVDTERKPLSRVICRTNRADAMMIVEALNAAEMSPLLRRLRGAKIIGYARTAPL